MKKVLFTAIAIALCNLFASAQLLSIYDVAKLVECGDNSCMFKYARTKGFIADEGDSFLSTDFHYTKSRKDISTISTDRLLLGISSYMNSVKFSTNDANFLKEYKSLIASGECKETGTKQALTGGVDHTFTFSKYPGYTGTFTIGKPYNGVIIYELFVCRFLI